MEKIPRYYYYYLPLFINIYYLLLLMSSHLISYAETTKTLKHATPPNCFFDLV